MVTIMQKQEHPIGERFRIACKEWEEARAIWRELKENKPIFLDELTIAVLRDAHEKGLHLSDAKAKRTAQTSDAWKVYIKRLLDAENRKNKAENEKDAIELERWERNDRNATAREERRSYRMGG